MSNLEYPNLMAEEGIYCKHELSRCTFLRCSLENRKEAHPCLIMK
jgi:hypothetical protein